MTFIQGGGLDRARQQQINDMKDEEDRLRTARAVHESGFGETSESRTWTFGDVQVLLRRLQVRSK